MQHVEFLGDNPLVHRITGLQRVPSRRTLARRLGALRKVDLNEIDRLMLMSAADTLSADAFPRLTVDIDGSVLSTGLTVKGAVRGYNPHQKNPSYYPITATVAQTGQVLSHRNRPGNVHDSHRAGDFLKTTVTRLRDRRADHSLVVHVRSAQDHRHWNAAGVGQNVPFCAGLCPIGGVGAGEVPPLVPSPSRCPASTSSGPNDVWTVDFQGWLRTLDKKRFEPLTVRDSFSRFVLCVQMLGSTRAEEVKAPFDRLFDRYGLPGAIRLDNGAPFACTSALGGLRLAGCPPGGLLSASGSPSAAPPTLRTTAPTNACTLM